MNKREYKKQKKVILNNKTNKQLKVKIKVKMVY